MAIEVKHGADPAALAAVGMGAGQGATRTRIRSAMLSATEQRIREERAREFSAEQSQIGREFSAEQSQISRDFSAEQSQIGREHQSDMLQSRMQYPATENRFTAQQKAEFDRLNEAYEEARRSGDFSEDELKELRRQIIAKQAGIKPLPTLEDGSKDPWTLAQARIFTDPGTGRQGYLDKDGVPQFYEDEGAFDKQEFLKRYETVKKDLTKPKFRKDVDGKMIEDGEEIPDAYTILKALQEQDKAMELYRQGASTDPGAGEVKTGEVKRGSPPNPAQRRQAAKERKEIEDRGQDPDEEYTDMRNPKNGKYVPLRHAMFYKPDGTLNSDEIKRASEYLAHTRGISVEAAEAVLVADIEEVWK